MKDQEGAARAVCDWSETARTADAAYALIDRAFGEFRVERKRPKSLVVPINLLESDAHSCPDKADAPSPYYLGVDLVADVKPIIKNAKRPLFIFGGGAARSPDWARQVLDRTGAACFMTYAGRGTIEDCYALNFGPMLARPSSANVIAKADVVIAVGTELSEVDLWRDCLGNEGQLIRVDLDVEVLRDRHAADLQVNAPASEFLMALLADLEGYTASTEWSAAEVFDFRTRMRAEIDAERPGILPVADRLKAALPANTMIYSDMTQFAYAAKEVYPMDRPGHWHHPYGFGTLGYALPAAIGGKIGVGDQPVIAILGDYGFQYTVQELAVAVELELTLPIIIWDNGKLGEIEDSMVRAQIAPNAVVQRNPDFCKLAAAYGAAAFAPTDLDAFEDAIRTALATKGPTVIRVKSDIALTSS
jgi:acetolactate synthase-1/2/3 large subunit/5-guanidino-2-oxopentanoate decarboxylase